MTEEGGKFARAITDKWGNGVLIVGGHDISSGPEDKIIDRVIEINDAHEKRLVEAIRKAKEEMREMCVIKCEEVNAEYSECPELAIYCADAIRSIEVKP